jgi:hypothetical protein
MGMDVYGVKPKNEKGEYFRNNVWWWRPLADFICNNYDDIASGCESWHSNDGDGLDGALAESLAWSIKEDIANGKVGDYEKQYNEWRSSLPREACNLCECTGIRTDTIAMEHGMSSKELSPEIQALTGRTHGWCNACNGVGTKESWLSYYPFEAENVARFAEFLENCGGFRIC